MEAARNSSRTVTATATAKTTKRKPLADRTNAPASQSSTSSHPADDVAATGSVVYYKRRKSLSGRSASLVARLMEIEGETLFNYSTEEDAPPPSILSKSLTEPPHPRKKKKKRLQQGSSNVLPQDFVDKQKAYFAEIDAFDLPVEVASSDDLD